MTSLKDAILKMAEFEKDRRMGSHEFLGAKDENIRLRPLILALAEVVEAAETWVAQVDAHGGDYLPGNRKQIGDALTRLRELVEGE